MELIILKKYLHYDIQDRRVKISDHTLSCESHWCNLVKPNVAHHHLNGHAHSGWLLSSAGWNATTCLGHASQPSTCRQLLPAWTGEMRPQSSRRCVLVNLADGDVMSETISTASSTPCASGSGLTMCLDRFAYIRSHDVYFIYLYGIFNFCIQQRLFQNLQPCKLEMRNIMAHSWFSPHILFMQTKIIVRNWDCNVIFETRHQEIIHLSVIMSFCPNSLKFIYCLFYVKLDKYK